MCWGYKSGKRLKVVCLYYCLYRSSSSDEVNPENLLQFKRGEGRIYVGRSLMLISK